MAKRKRKHARKSSGGRRRVGGGGRRRRRSGGGASYGGIDVMELAVAGGYGFLESAAAKDKESLLNKIPRPIEQLGYVGGTALAAWAANKFFPHPILRKAVKTLSTIAIYQMGRTGGLLKSAAAPLTISGYGHAGGERVLSDEGVGEIVDEHVGTLQMDGGGGSLHEGP